MLSSPRKQKKPDTKSEHCIPASMFQPFFLSSSIAIVWYAFTREHSFIDFVHETYIIVKYDSRY